MQIVSLIWQSASTAIVIQLLLHCEWELPTSNVTEKSRLAPHDRPGSRQQPRHPKNNSKVVVKGIPVYDLRATASLLRTNLFIRYRVTRQCPPLRPVCALQLNLVRNLIEKFCLQLKKFTWIPLIVLFALIENMFRCARYQKSIDSQCRLYKWTLCHRRVVSFFRKFIDCKWQVGKSSRNI